MKKGFSLVELLIVIVVIASLISIATIVSASILRKTKATTVARNMKAIMMAAEEKLMIDGPKYFQSIKSLKDLVKNATDQYQLYLVIKKSGDVYITVICDPSHVDAKLVNEISPDATIVSSEVRCYLKDGEAFHKITYNNNMVHYLVGSYVTYIPENRICIFRDYRLF
jgi:prepilin-type N-terminal cleavage/methylation domain-containing protein